MQFQYIEYFFALIVSSLVQCAEEQCAYFQTNERIIYARGYNSDFAQNGK